MCDFFCTSYREGSLPINILVSKAFFKIKICYLLHFLELLEKAIELYSK